jgi:patatin-like phospholipase/acyl hydrolase
MPNYLILSLDGGGTRGIIQIEFLKYLEIHLGQKLVNKFDMFAGNSMGGINALLISSESVDGGCLGCADFYDKDKVNRIMNKSSWDRMLPFHNGHIYDGNGKRGVLEEMMKHMPMNELKKRTIISTYNLTTDSPYVFDSNYDTAFIHELADATSATPTYFPPVLMDNSTAASAPVRTTTHLYTDGGVFASNPTMCAVSAAVKSGVPLSDIKVISIGSGTEGVDIDERGSNSWRIFRWLTNGFSNSLITAPSQNTNKIAKNLLGDNYIRINRPIKQKLQKINNTDERSLNELKDIGKEWFTNTRDSIDRLLSI